MYIAFEPYISPNIYICIYMCVYIYIFGLMYGSNAMYFPVDFLSDESGY